MTIHYRDAALLQQALTHSKRIVHNHVYLVAQASVGERFVRNATSDLAGKNVTFMIQQEYSNKHGFAGTDIWLRWLDEAGIPETRIVTVSGVADERFRLGDSRRLNTLTETRGVIRCADERNLHGTTFVMPQFHELRVAITAATVCMELGAQLDISFLPIQVGGWNDEITHSQGVQGDTVGGICAAELEKVAGENRYMNLCTPGAALAWFCKNEK